MVAKMGSPKVGGGLAAALGDKGRKAVEGHRGDETKLSGGGEIPAGVEGKAKLTDCRFSKHEKGEHKGKWFFYAAGTVVTPTEVLAALADDGVQRVSASGAVVTIEGRRTSITEPMYDTPTRSRTTVDEHVEFVLNQFRLLGVDTSNVAVEQMEVIAEALKKAQPTFNFRTWAGKPATEGKYKGQAPTVQHDWRGICEEDAAPTSDGVDDKSGDEPEENPANEADLDALATAADQEGDAADEDAQAQLTEIANGLGIDDTKIGKAKNWAAVVKMIRAATPEEPKNDAGESGDSGETEMTLEELGAKADEGDDDAIGTLTEEAEKAGLDPNEYPTWSELAEAIGAESGEGSEPAIPEVGDTGTFFPTIGGKVSKKAVKVEVVAVFEKVGKVNLRNTEDGKTSYKAVLFDNFIKK